MLLDDIGLSSRYNLAADSFNLDPIGITARTKLFGLFDINYGAIVDPYERITTRSATGVLASKRTNTLQWDKRKSLGNIISSNLAFGFNLNSQKIKNRFIINENLLEYKTSNSNGSLHNDY